MFADEVDAARTSGHEGSLIAVLLLETVEEVLPSFFLQGDVGVWVEGVD